MEYMEYNYKYISKLNLLLIKLLIFKILFNIYLIQILFFNKYPYIFIRIYFLFIQSPKGIFFIQIFRLINI